MAYSAEKDSFPFVGQDDDTDIILFFTDNKNEPRKLNVRRSIEDDVTFSGNALNYSGGTLKDFITACPKSPQIPIRFTWVKNPDFESNFRNTNGFQFAYQNVYVDGFLSAISTISSVSYPRARISTEAGSFRRRSIRTKTASFGSNSKSSQEPR